MRKQIKTKVEIPKEVEIIVKGNEVTVKGKNGEVKRKFQSDLKIENVDGFFEISHPKASKREIKVANSIMAHIKNMIRGIQNKFEYKMKVCFSHFPINVSVEDNRLLIKNFLGETKSREAAIPEDVEVVVNKDAIVISSSNREAAGQTAANFERATKIKNRDRRVFQDGIFITEKPQRELNEQN